MLVGQADLLRIGLGILALGLQLGPSVLELMLELDQLEVQLAQVLARSLVGNLRFVALLLLLRLLFREQIRHARGQRGLRSLGNRFFLLNRLLVILVEFE